MKPVLEVGRYVKYMPRHRSFGDLSLAAEFSGLSPRMIYKIEQVLDDSVLVVNGGQAHVSDFVDGELEFKLGKIDNSWVSEKERSDSRKANFEGVSVVSKKMLKRKT